MDHQVDLEQAVRKQATIAWLLERALFDDTITWTAEYRGQFAPIVRVLQHDGVILRAEFSASCDLLDQEHVVLFYADDVLVAVKEIVAPGDHPFILDYTLRVGESVSRAS